MHSKLSLSCLSVDSSSRNFIAQQGGVMLISNSMGALYESSEVQEAGLAALCNLASDVDEEILQVSDICSVVNASLSHHIKDHVVQTKGLALLHNLSMRGTDIKSSIIASGCLKCVIKALEINMGCSAVIASALRMLVNLSDTKQGVQVICQREVVTLITRTMMVNIQNMKTAMVGCKILYIISQKLSINSIIQVGVVEAILCVMMFHHSSEYIQSMGCNMLSDFISKSQTEKVHDDDVFDQRCHIVEALLSAMCLFPESFRIQECSSAALRNMLKHEKNMVIFKTEQSHIDDILTQTMIKFPECQEDCEAVLAILDG